VRLLFSFLKRNADGRPHTAHVFSIQSLSSGLKKDMHRSLYICMFVSLCCFVPTLTSNLLCVFVKTLSCLYLCFWLEQITMITLLLLLISYLNQTWWWGRKSDKSISFILLLVMITSTYGSWCERHHWNCILFSNT
jgi:hypothetical protein